LAEPRRARIGADCIISIGGRIVLIERRNPPPGWALPGGLVDEGETVETAVRREMMEETGLELDDLRLFGVYSDPGRDPRFDCISVVFTAKGRGELKAGDDARVAKLVALDEVSRMTLAFDHGQILADYAG
jgi:ADP-ribose pyrophosphatase YjhB (NUDIX family)